ncbi:hypothetical protein pwc_30 [Weissella phage PWc]|nr:hypothetical protein pwc_30 [Weissella phage PWc]
MKTYENGTHYDFTKPAHNAGDVIKQAVKGGKNEMAIVHLGNVLKYSIRLFKKHDDPVKDAQKIVNYAQELLAELQGDEYVYYVFLDNPWLDEELSNFTSFTKQHVYESEFDRHIYRGNNETTSAEGAIIADLEYVGYGKGKDLV